MADSSEADVGQEQMSAQLKATAEILRSRLSLFVDDSLSKVLYAGGNSLTIRFPEFSYDEGGYPWFLGTGNVNLSFVATRQRIASVVELLNGFSEDPESATPTVDEISNAIAIKPSSSNTADGPFLTIIPDQFHDYAFPASQIADYHAIVNNHEFQDSLKSLLDFDYRLAISMYPDEQDYLNFYLLEGPAYSLTGAIKKFDSDDNALTQETYAGIALDSPSGERLAQLTRDNIGRKMAVLVDDRAIVSGPIRIPLENGRLNFPFGADNFPAHVVNRMLSGEKLPVKLEIVRRELLIM